MDTLGRDEELRTLHAFLDRPAGGLAALVLEGEAGIGKSTLWLRRRRSCTRARVTHPLLPAGRGRAWGRAHCAGRPAGRRARRRAARAGRPDAMLSRPHFCSENGRDAAGGCPNPRRGRPQRAAPACGARADPDRNRRRAVAGRLLRERVDVCGEAVVGAERPPAARPPARGRHTGIGAGACARRPETSSACRSVRSARARCTRSCTIGSGATFARPTLLRLHEASGGNPFFALELARALGADVDPTQPLPVPATLEALVRARLDGLPDETRATPCCSLAHTAGSHTSTSRRRHTRARVRRRRDRGRGAGSSASRTRCSPPSSTRRASPRIATQRARTHSPRSPTIQLARARHRALAASEPDAAIAAELEAGRSRCDRTRCSDRRGGARRARRPC